MCVCNLINVMEIACCYKCGQMLSKVFFVKYRLVDFTEYCLVHSISKINHYYSLISDNVYVSTSQVIVACGGAVVEALRYKPEGHGFDSRCHFSLT
jgi:hypothetical protein